MVGGKQYLSLADPGCWFADTIVHEFIHAWGFYHEQSRPDRDQYITVNWDNIKTDKHSQYEIKGGTHTYGVQYDGKSVMHYSTGGFANGNGPTMTSKVCLRFV